MREEHLSAVGEFELFASQKASLLAPGRRSLLTLGMALAGADFMTWTVVLTHLADLYGAF